MEIKDLIHYYLGCKVWEVGNNIGKLYAIGMLGGDGNMRALVDCSSNVSYWTTIDNLKLILRPLSSMTDEEMKGLIKVLFSDNQDKIDDDELDVDVFYWDNGTMVDSDIRVGANISCRCFEGQLAIRECGSMFLFDDQGELTKLYNVPAGIHYLLSRGFDLFGLIPSGQAIDSTKTHNLNT